jgi:hypothetical protein
MRIRPVFLCLLILTLFLCFCVQAQDRKPNSPAKQRVLDIDDLPKNVVKLNILSLAVGTGSVFYERIIAEHMSVQLGLSYTSISNDWLLDMRYKGYSITPEFRYYLSSIEAPRGFFVAPFARYRSAEVTSSISRNGREIPANGKISAYGAGVMIGGQIIGKRLSAEAFVGPSLNARSIKVTSPEVTERELPIPNILGIFGLRAGVTVGIAF